MSGCRIRIWIGALLLLIAGTAAGEAATPADTYQAIEAVNAQLAAFHDANGTMPAVDPQAPPLTERLPRHVLQKAREVLLKIQAVRQLNGLPLQPVPEIAVREVQPDDVKFFVEKMLLGLKDLRPIFGNPPVAKLTRASREMGPTDNFAALRRAELQVDGLGLPATSPNDVMRIALSIVNDLELVRSSLGVTAPAPSPPVIPARRPVDTYDNAIGLLVDIKVLTENNPSLAIPMGVVLPERRTGNIKPAHVMDLLGSVLAEISAIKAKTGVTIPTVLAPPQTGMTPSDVHSAVSHARALVASLPGARVGGTPDGIRKVYEPAAVRKDGTTNRVYTVEDFAKPDAKLVRRHIISQSEHAVVTGWHILPGQGLEPHRHPEGQDTWVVLAGEADYLMGGGKSRKIKAGDIAIATTGQVHGARNTGTSPFIFVSTVTPADAGVEPGEN